MSDPPAGGWSGQPLLGQYGDMAGRAGLRVMRTDVGVALSGDIDVETWGDLSRALGSVVRSPPADRIVVDLSDLAFIDAHGVRIIAEAAESLDPPRHLSLVRPPPGLVRIVEILELHRLPGLVIQDEGDVA